jgi:glycosyltransferase involved in cell wall biosynthesis
VKQVLIITFHYIKKETIGSIRLRGVAKYLPDFGWEPIILTPQSGCISSAESYCKVIETQYNDIATIWKKRLGFKTQSTVKKQLGKPTCKNNRLLIDYVLKVWEEIFAYPDANIGWYMHAVKAGEKLLAEGSYDAILSSSNPATCHLVAKKLKDNFGIPWVADFRDLWIQNHYIEHLLLRKVLEKRLEHKTISNADLLTTVSNPLAVMLKQLHWDKKVHTIINGFDPNQLNPGANVSDKFTIVYTGVLYQGKRDPEPLFQAISELIKSGKICSSNIEIQFYGTDDEWLFNDIKKYNLEKVVNVNGPISREESIHEQRKAQVLLLLTWNHPDEKGVYTGKLFDYLAAQRPVLAMGIPGSVIEELLDETQSGLYVSSIEELKSAILSYYQEYKLTGKVTYKGNPVEIEKYSHREMARKFAEVLDSITI